MDYTHAGILAVAIAGVLFIRANFESWISHVSHNDEDQSENSLINLFKFFN